MDRQQILITSLALRNNQLDLNHLRYNKVMPLTKWRVSDDIVKHLPKVGSIILTRVAGSTDYLHSVVVSRELANSDYQWSKASPIVYYTNDSVPNAVKKQFLAYMNQHNLPLKHQPLAKLADDEPLWNKSF